MLCFKSGHYKGGVEYYLETDQFDFDCLWDVVNRAVCPDSIDKIQITSWTIARSFEKDGLHFYIEEFYDDDPSRFTIRLFPFGVHSTDEVKRLSDIVSLIESSMSSSPSLQ